MPVDDKQMIYSLQMDMDTLASKVNKMNGDVFEKNEHILVLKEENSQLLDDISYLRAQLKEEDTLQSTVNGLAARIITQKETYTKLKEKHDMEIYNHGLLQVKYEASLATTAEVKKVAKELWLDKKWLSWKVEGNHDVAGDEYVPLMEMQRDDARNEKLKKLGAKWGPFLSPPLFKRWYVPPAAALLPFVEWMEVVSVM